MIPIVENKLIFELKFLIAFMRNVVKNERPCSPDMFANARTLPHRLRIMKKFLNGLRALIEIVHHEQIVP